MPRWIASMFVCAQDIPVHRQSTRRLSLRFHSDASQQPSTEVLRATVTVAAYLVECSGRASVYADIPAVRARVRAQTSGDAAHWPPPSLLVSIGVPQQAGRVAASAKIFTSSKN